MKKILLLTLCCLFSNLGHAQEVQIDGRLQPLLNDFFDLCKQYNIEYHDKLFQLETIDIVSNLPISENATTLGMLRRDEHGVVKSIDINWVAQLDHEILKVVAFHEFAHYFLEYATHVCDDCGIIMSVVNTSYFDIVNDWKAQIKKLFEDSPAYKKKFGPTVSVIPLRY